MTDTVMANWRYLGPAVVFLASKDSGWITGEMLHITGGYR